MAPRGCITLLTDYGLTGGFVGALHAVAQKLAPGVTVVDLDHAIPAGDVRLGALRLERLVPLLPPGVHVGVVDPGVGGGRRAVALQAGEDHVFVGPDNGLLVWAAEALSPAPSLVVLDREEYFLERRSRTFDGRDVFVPVAAHLARGCSLADVGSPADPGTLERCRRPAPRRLGEAAWELEVLQVDGFGNVQFSGDAAHVRLLGLEPGDPVVVEGGGVQLVATFAETFSDVGRGAPVVLVDSDGQLSLALNAGRADEVLRAPLGATVVLRRP
ncbi:MAG TPA: SAM-dependent chlorinase/fluorinase [Acidimicrobiales bacterium]|nr:SAM-dependent chlorinase/fluorinase [Acidimicrobiales bacterium]